MSTRYETFQIRRGSSADFAAANTLLASGEPAYAIDTKILKVGDGVSRWNSLGGITGGITGDVPAGVASQDYVLNAISGVIDAAPSLLNTLNELAAALGDDANFATTVVSSINQKANLAGGNTFTGYNVIPSGNGNFNILSISGVGVSVKGHSHVSSDITNFATSVSGIINNGYGLSFNSPTLTGVPLTPTAASGTNTNQIASTAYVRTEVSNLVNSAPSTLDTLNELATALGNDANFSTTVTNSIATKAALSGATFTGLLTGVSGNFTQSLQLNGTGVSLTGHTHTASNITDFNSSVSGLLPVTSIIAGTNLYLWSNFR